MKRLRLPVFPEAPKAQGQLFEIDQLCQALRQSAQTQVAQVEPTPAFAPGIGDSPLGFLLAFLV